MNTTSGSEPPKDLVVLEKSAVSSKLEDSAAALEARLQGEIDQRKEERFYWIFGTSILIDLIALPHQNVLVGTAILGMQVILLLSLSKWLGVEHVAVPLQRLLEKYLPKKDKDEDW